MRMKNCCEITFKNALEEVITIIHHHKITRADHVIIILEKAIDKLKEGIDEEAKK